jgi:hypothetical protein
MRQLLHMFDICQRYVLHMEDENEVRIIIAYKDK